MQDTHIRPPTPDAELPRRLRLDHPHQHGILLDHQRKYTVLAGWFHTVAPDHATRLIRVARELVENAHRHSRSGLPGGTVRIVLDWNRSMLPHLYVTDNGPLNGNDIAYPRLEKRAPDSGLAMVERHSVYWDFSWDWDGTSIRATTVQVVFDLTAPRMATPR
ncbi:ATP-binding protein [Nocardiopsis terrae]